MVGLGEQKMTGVEGKGEERGWEEKKMVQFRKGEINGRVRRPRETRESKERGMVKEE